jgi:hypothetical protein
MDCPNCGERIKAGVAFHKQEEGTLCILDWKRAVASGVRTRQQAYEATGEEQYATKIPTAPSKPQADTSAKPKASIPTEDDLDVV